MFYSGLLKAVIEVIKNNIYSGTILLEYLGNPMQIGLNDNTK